MLMVSWAIGGILYFLVYSYLFSTIVCNEKFKIDIKSIIAAIGIVILNFIIMEFNITFSRPYIIHIYLFLALVFVYRKSLVQTLLCTLFIIFIVGISEMVSGILLSFVFKVNLMNIVDTPFGYTVLNSSILLCTILVFKIRFVSNKLSNIIKWYNKNEQKSLMIFFFLLLTIVIFLLYNNFVNLLPTSFLWFTNLFCAAVFVFVFGFFKEKTSKNKIIYEYDQLLDYVKTYEKILNEKSKNQHEYKNQLVLIRDMIKNKKTIKYINELLEIDSNEQDSEWINKIKNIPQGGLKGLMYYKIDTMLKKKINLFVNVSKELENDKLWVVCNKNLQDVSKVLGVYLDNAIEAAVDSKEKYIIIEVYLKNKDIVFRISNTYLNKITIDKIDKEGYTTKGVGKGYGLSLVKDIISKNSCLEQNRELNGIYYTQNLYIKKKV